MAEGLQKPVTQYEVAKKLVEAAVYVAAGLGFEVTFEFKNTVPTVGAKGTIEEGLRDSMKASMMVVAGAGIDPRALMIGGPERSQGGVVTPPKGLILPGQ